MTTGETPIQAAPMESVLVDGVAYNTPGPVAAELVGLHIELLQTKAELARAKEFASTLNRILHDMITAEQAAWIEWRHGAGADAAMRWIHNGLAGPGHIPDENAPYGKEPQAWFDANQAEPFPQCFCGRPSNTLWMGQGFCSQAHYAEAKARQEGGAA